MLDRARSAIAGIRRDTAFVSSGGRGLGVANGITGSAFIDLEQSLDGGDSYPTAIARYAFAQVGQDSYVISGVFIGNGAVRDVRRYNAATNVWTSCADIPGLGSEGPVGAFFGGKIYVADGGAESMLLRIYDIATNTWSAGPVRPGPTSSYGAAAGAFNGNFYVVGGGFPPTTTLSIYNIASNTWSVGPAAPSPFLLGGYAQIGQFLYLIGGFTSTTGVNTTVSMRLDMATNTWSTGPVWTPQRADFALAAVGTRLIAIGGDSNGGSFYDPSAQVDELDTSTWPGGAWVPSPHNLPSARQANSAGFFSTGRVGGEIWSTGGIASDFVFLSEHLFRASGPLLLSAVSRKTHSDVGSFDIPLALTGPATTEPRSGGPNNTFTVVFNFTNPLAAVDEATVSCGSVGSRLVDPSDTRRYIVNMTGVVCNANDVGITLIGVRDTFGSTLANTTAAIGLLRGDTNNDRVVNAADALQTRNRSGQVTVPTNFRSDVNTDGVVNSGDTIEVRARSGTFLP